MSKPEYKLDINRTLEQKIEQILDRGGHINGQRRFPVVDMRFGAVKAGSASCELIAVFNVLRDCGRHVSLSDIIFDAEREGFLLFMGLFGTKIGKIGRILEKHGIKYRRESVKEFKKNSRQLRYNDGQIFIATIKTRRELPFWALHTFEMVYKNGLWTAYNRFDFDNAPSVYSAADEVLSNGKTRGSWRSVYMITE